MPLDSKHPLYATSLEYWTKCRDVYGGEQVVKSKTTEYLPATEGQVLDGMKKADDIGFKRYQSYLMRAVFHDYFSEGVEMLLGLLHQKACTFELPSEMEPLIEKATLDGESLEMLLRRINEQQLVTGRVALFADLPMIETNDPKVLPLISLYEAETVTNWDVDDNKNLVLVVLTENGQQRKNSDPFSWEEVKKYRVLQLLDGSYLQGSFVNTNDFSETGMKAPMHRGAVLKEIPFQFINSKDIISLPDKPPLIGLAELALAIYRGEADYRNNLYMQGQDTLVVVGTILNQGDPNDPDSNDAIRVGAGSRINVDSGGSASYIGVSSTGLPEQRMSLENDRSKAAEMAGAMINNKGSNVESGAALRTRLGAQTATLNQIADSGAEGLQEMLRKIAVWIGADPKKVVVTPNREFTDFEMVTDEFVKMMTARAQGLPLSKESIHAILVERGYTKLSYEDEIKLVEEEMMNDAPIDPNRGLPGALPNQPPNQPPNQQGKGVGK